MSIKASEISSVIRDQINNFENQADISEVGTVLKVGDGVAQVYGLDNVQAGEMVEFDGGVKGMALNLEEIMLVSFYLVMIEILKKATQLKEQKVLLRFRLVKAYLEELWMVLEIPSMEKDLFKAVSPEG